MDLDRADGFWIWPQRPDSLDSLKGHSSSQDPESVSSSSQDPESVSSSHSYPPIPNPPTDPSTIFPSLTNFDDKFNSIHQLSIMKLSALIVLAGASAASAFVPSASSSRAATTLAARPDASAAIKEALEASKKFGATSSEARVAWDIVEEMDSSDNR